MKLNELPIGQVFTFSFDLGSAWSYKKLNHDMLLCVSAPDTETASIGRTYGARSLSLENAAITPVTSNP